MVSWKFIQTVLIYFVKVPKKREENCKNESAKPVKLTSVCFTEQKSLEESVAECPCCGIVYGDDDESLWICCDHCNTWYDFKCTTLTNRCSIPETYFCQDCC